MRPLRPWLLAALLAPLAGCAALVRTDLAMFGIDYDASGTPAHLPRASWQLLIEEPHAVEPLTDVRIALVAPDGEYAVLPATRWREPPPQMFRSLLVEAFAACACVAGAARSDATMHGDFLLTVELRHFELRDDGTAPPLATVEAALTLVRIADGRAVGSQRIVHAVRARRRDAAAGVGALGEAMNAAVAEALRWVHERGSE